MRYLFILFFISITLNICAQDDKTVTLVVSGQGATQEEARQKALRSAIEQAFGTFISSKTEILNDNLVKDEIVSVANGNIQKFDVISETLLPNNTYASTLNATVSISKLTTFCQSKGINAEFKGGLFAMNIALQELNEKNEKQGVDNLYRTFIDILPKCLDYKIVPSEPVNEDNKWKIQLNINFILNKNYDILTNFVLQFAKSISMNEADVNSYRSLNKPVYTLKIHRDKSFEEIEQANLIVDTFYFRNQHTYESIISFPYTILKFIISNINYNNSLESHSIFSYFKKYTTIENKTFVYIDSKIPFYRYLDRFISGSGYDKYLVDISTTMFQNSDVNVNGGMLEIMDGNPKFITSPLKSFDKINDNKLSYIFNGKLYTSLTSGFFYQDEFNLHWFKEDFNSKVKVPGTPIYNLLGHSGKEFLNINLSEYFTIEEIKMITEYKVSLK